MAKASISPKPILKQPCSHDDLKSFLLYSPEDGTFEWKPSPLRSAHWNSLAVSKKTGHLTRTGYISLALFGTDYLAHRIAWFYMTGEWPGESIDHINGDKADNKFSNLRLCSHRQNCYNRGKNKNNTSGYKGVFYEKRARSKPWFARLKNRHLGSFETADAAHKAYSEAIQQSYGEFGKS